MQTIETKTTEPQKQDYRKEIAHLNRRLQAYRTAYIKERDHTLEEFKSDPRHVTQEQHGYHALHLALQVEKRVEAQFPDLTGVTTPYHHGPTVLEQVYRNFWYSQIRPLNHELDEQVRAHWKKVWRAERVDFRALPPAPAPNYQPADTPQGLTTVSKKDHTYQFGQITVQIGGEKKYRSILFCAGDVRLWVKDAYEITIAHCLDIALPIAKRFDRVCDWSCTQHLSTPAQHALRLRCDIITSYYTREYDRGLGCTVPGWNYRARLCEFAFYGEKEELAAILQVEKDRHAPRHQRITSREEGRE